MIKIIDIVKLLEIKKKLNLLFDTRNYDDVRHRAFNWFVIALIIISSLELFLTTFSEITEKYGDILDIVDVFVTIIFTIEVSLRIWAADELSPKYKGVWGRVKYCLSFSGMLDILSTYPAFIGLFVPIPAVILRVFRMGRLLRIFSLLDSFRLLGNAIASKKQEIGISFVILSLLTVVLSFLLYYAEHEAQPELCENAWMTLVWAFAKYLGDPGQIADFPLVTIGGNVIAAIVGALGIAIFAVPVGLIGSGFIEEMENMRTNQTIANNTEVLHHSFRWSYDQHSTKLFFVPPFISMLTLLEKHLLQEKDVVEVIRSSSEFHLYNIERAYNSEDEPVSRLVVVHSPHNRPYGCCIDRGSKVTIVSASGYDEPITSWVAYHVAKLGGFNYISKDVEMDIDAPISFYTIKKTRTNEHMESFLSDLNNLSGKPDSWVIPFTFCSGPKSRDKQVHLCYNVLNKSAYDGATFTPDNSVLFSEFCSEFSEIMNSNYLLDVGMNEYYGISKANILRNISCKNGFVLRMECRTIYFPADKFARIKTIADTLRKYFANGEAEPDLSDIDTKGRRPVECFGFRNYNEWKIG